MTAVLLVLSAAATGFAQTAPGRRVAESIGISGHSGSFTELYFAQPADVGNSAPTGNSKRRQRAVSFVIHSHERTGRTYAWTIKTDTGKRLAAGAAVVSAGGSARIGREVTVCPAHSRDGKSTRFRGYHTPVQIQVDLANPAESIGYWTRCDA